jgi:hypothetical protein
VGVAGSENTIVNRVLELPPDFETVTDVISLKASKRDLTEAASPVASLSQPIHAVVTLLLPDA